MDWNKDIITMKTLHGLCMRERERERERRSGEQTSSRSSGELERAQRDAWWKRRVLTRARGLIKR